MTVPVLGAFTFVISFHRRWEDGYHHSSFTNEEDGARGHSWPELGWNLDPGLSGSQSRTLSTGLELLAKNYMRGRKPC